MLDVGVTPQAMVIPAGAVIVGNAAGVTVIVLETDKSALPQISVAVQVSVIVPPHGPGAALNVDVLDVPLIRHDPLCPFEYGNELDDGTTPHATVISAGAVIVGNVAGVMVIILETDAKGLPQISVAVHVSVTVPPHAPGAVLNVDELEMPLIKQAPLWPLVYGSVLGAGIAPHATVILAGAVIVGNAAGVTVMIRLPVIVRLHASVNVQLSVSVPPQLLAEPVLTAVTVPDIKHAPGAEFV